VTTITLSFPNGSRQDVLLAGVPRKGDHIRLNGNGAAPSLVVEHILWMEDRGRSPEPTVLIVVRPHVEGPPG
jgi:hypothetical protein